MGADYSGHHRRSAGAGWAYLLAGIVLVFAAGSINPAFVSALIVLVIGAGLLYVGLRRFGLTEGLCCCGCCSA